MLQIEGGKTYNVSTKENGDRFWYLNNKLHREIGPAIELASGSKAYYFEGVKISCSSQKEFEKQVGLKKEAGALKYWDVKIEANVPAQMSFRIMAKTPEEALQKAKIASPNHIQYKLAAKKSIKGSVYQAGTTLVKLVKNLLGS